MTPWNCSAPNTLLCLYANVRGVRYLEIYCEYGQLPVEHILNDFVYM